ncbi:MAG: TlpA family protein disulfide reductase [Deltaproteobacteria bacterium]|nr:TlpA family protein disulfide reductase [Deltaproteobacteria bacterium]
MIERIRSWLGWALVIGLVAWMVAGRPGCGGGLRVEDGGPAPPFAVTDSSGREWTPESFAGRPYALVFFATWCRSCRDDLPMLSRTAAERPDAAFLAISDEAPATIGAYLSRARLSLPAAGQGQGAFHSYGVRALPSAVLVGADGLVAYSGEGPSAVEKAIRMLVR